MGKSLVKLYLLLQVPPLSIKKEETHHHHMVMKKVLCTAEENQCILCWPPPGVVCGTMHVKVLLSLSHLNEE